MNSDSWIGLTICTVGAIYSARVLFDLSYCLKVIHRVYRASDDQTERIRVRGTRLTATVTLVAFSYYAARIIFTRP